MDAFGIVKKSIFLGLFIVLSLAGCKQDSEQKLMIATAASLRLPLIELTKEFTKESGIECEIVVASSGKLSAQIQAGAPYDVFISANMKYPDHLYEKGFSAKPKVIGYGKLILWSSNDSIYPSFELLLKETVHHVALANPKTAPYGEAAVEVLRHYNLFGLIKEKLVYGESVSQTDQFILTGVAEFGFSSISTILSLGKKQVGHWKEIDRDFYSPIEHGSVVIKNERGLELNAEAFIEFIHTGKGRNIMEKFGLEI